MKEVLIKKRHWLTYNFLFFIEHFTGRKLFVKYFGKLENNLIQKVKHNIGKQNISGNFKIIDLQEGEYSEPIIDKRNPVIFRGAAKNWKCSEEWNVEYFKTKYGDNEVTLPDNVGVNDKKNPNKLTKLKMKDFIKQLEEGSKNYLQFSRIISDPKILGEYLGNNWLQKFKRWFAFSNTHYFFIGGKGTKTPIHNGFAATVFVQMEGQRKWVFYSPENMMSLGVRPERRSYYYSDADPYNTNDENYPLQKNAKKFEITLNPGDVLWFPPLIFHQVENHSTSLGLAFKFVDIPMAFKSSKMMASLFFLSTKPNIFSMFLGARIYDNDYIFTKDKDEYKVKVAETD